MCHTRLNTACPPFFTFLYYSLCKTRSSLLALFHPFKSIFASFPFPHSPFQSIANRHAAKAFVTLHPFDVPICKQRRWCQLIATSLHNPRYSPQTSSHKHRRLTHTCSRAISRFIFSLPPTTWPKRETIMRHPFFSSPPKVADNDWLNPTHEAGDVDGLIRPGTSGLGCWQHIARIFSIGHGGS